MAEATIAVEANSIDFPQLFGTYTQRMASWLLATVAEAGLVLPSELRSQAMQVLAYATELADAWPLASQLLLKLAVPMEQAGLRDEWLPYLQRGIAASQRQQDTETEAHLRLSVGQLCQLRSQFEQAAQQLQQSAVLFAALGDQPQQAVALNRWAYVAILQGQPALASELTNRAEGLLREADPEHAYCHFVWGMVAKSQEDWGQTEHHFRQALTLRRQEGDSRQIALALLNLGTALRPLTQYDEAKYCYLEAITLFELLEDVVYLAGTQMNLGIIYYCSDDFSKALDYYLLAEKTFREIKDEARLAAVYNNIGLCHIGLSQWLEAIEALIASIDRYSALKNYAMLVETMFDLVHTCIELKQKPKAVQLLNEAKGYLPEISSMASRIRLQSLIHNYHLELFGGAQSSPK